MRYRCIMNGGASDTVVLDRDGLEREIDVAGEFYRLLVIDGVASRDIAGCFRYMLRYHDPVWYLQGPSQSHGQDAPPPQRSTPPP